MLVNAANSGLIRLFCARHVIDEFYEHAEEWAQEAEIDLPVFLARWDAEYLPVLRVVDIPPGLLTPAEAERIALLEHGPKKFRDPDDVPTATLALLLGAYLLSGDGAPLRAVYGPDTDLTEHDKWFGMPLSGGNAGVLRQMQKDNEETVAFAGRSVFTVLEPLWTEVSPIAALLLGGAAVYGYRRMSRVDWNHLDQALKTIYGYSSDLLHSGKPFPPMMVLGRPEQDDNGVLAERPNGEAFHSSGIAGWMPAEVPMYLWTFAHLVRGALLNWWREQAAAQSEP